MLQNTSCHVFSKYLRMFCYEMFDLHASKSIQQTPDRGTLKMLFTTPIGESAENYDLKLLPNLDAIGSAWFKALKLVSFMILSIHFRNLECRRDILHICFMLRLVPVPYRYQIRVWNVVASHLLLREKFHCTSMYHANSSSLNGYLFGLNARS